jgi:RHS repeat-associated protein
VSSPTPQAPLQRHLTTIRMDRRLDEKTSSLNEQKKFTGYINDIDTGLNYANARYQNPSTGQFISEDPASLAVGSPSMLKQETSQNQQTYLANPQRLNSYSYAGDNPVLKTDPTGKAFGVDDAAGFIIGGTVGYISQAGVSLFTTGNFPTTGQSVNAIVIGGIIGWGAVNTPETLGVSNAFSASIVAGLIGGFYGDLAKQGIDTATGKQTGGLNYGELNTSAVITAGTNGLFGGLPDAEFSGLSSGRNNMNAIGDAMRTKAVNGTINNMSVNTALKSAIGSQVSDLYRTVAGAVFNSAQSSIEGHK